MEDFIKNYGTLIVAIIAFLALIRPELKALWERHFRQGEIYIYVTGNLEIGYSAFGPTIGLHGTLRCKNQDMFVQNIKLKLIKKKDQSKHVFDWGVFRSGKITFGQESQASFELPYGFMLMNSTSRPFNIQFQDLKSQSEMREIIDTINQEWSKQSLPLLLAKVDLTQFVSFYENTFSKSTIHIDSYKSLNRIYYWEEGDYSLELTVLTSKPDKPFIKNYKFSLTKQDADKIGLNIVKLLPDVCGLPPKFKYFFANPSIEEN